MKRALAVLAGLVLLAGLGGLAAYLYKGHLEGNVHGSSTEFNPTQTAPPPPPPSVKQKIVWPMFAYDMERTHVGPTVPVRPPFRRAWTAGGASLLEFPPAIGWNRLFLANGSGHLIAVSTKTGRRAWSYDARRCQAASPALADIGHGTVYEVFLNRKPCKAKRPGDGEVVALAVGTGKLRWSTHIGASETSPVVVGNRLYVGDWLGDIRALDARTGRIIWTTNLGAAVKGAVAVNGDTLYVGAYNGHVYSLAARNGHVIWRGSADSRLLGSSQFYSTPALAYGRMYIGSTDGKVYSFGATTGHRIWSYGTGGYVYGSPAVWKQLVLVGSYSHRFYAFDAATGAVRWTFTANGPISGSATVIDGVVYFATLTKGGQTYALSAKTGKLLWTFPDGRYTPVAADRRHLYLLGYAKIYAFTPRG